MSRILVIDNYDSFVYNLVQYLAQLGAEVEVWRNDDPRFGRDGWHEGFDGVLVSPGPGTPEDAGVCVDVIATIGRELPVFGVCLGLQAMAVAFGAGVTRAPQLRHGKTSRISHDGRGCFAGLPNPMTVTRYHSLAVDPATVPDELEVSSTTDDGIIMAMRHCTLPVEAVQFHPESVLSEGGYPMLANWLTVCGDDQALTRAEGLAPLMTATHDG
ncbi:aminodeoxychorismate/anthranilate synthase component II [Propionibacterium australiense]|uniref:Anthranilate synthase n=1 Tax=Propionibacterium australiense TaxID=119981 RepID=A0A383S8W1_9ACTN|nr:aminodeoxychorismate/anthranilate synthase component II [Propionibacterium australiense]RLP07665.1 aminodeoxychorismate/anthranilate synthase component II [Propionibacterium australiense]RLP08092.1 aminodeoxychorismate/anthranilate synthase component II [Propionibacterium australiense]SYZ33706.1 anthranilate synthase [Propionibacterium australiense]VEH92865.1 Anthranilate synthase component II [Propionibacterium australiense]